MTPDPLAAFRGGADVLLLICEPVGSVGHQCWWNQVDTADSIFFASLLYSQVSFKEAK